MNKVALIVGAGDAIGGAIAKKFAKQGMTVCVTRRTESKIIELAKEINQSGGKAFGFACDARKEEETISLFKQIEEEIGEIDVMVFNVGANVPMSILDTSSRKFSKIWEMACFAGFLNGREAAKHMIKRNKGTIIFTGATASMRGGANFAAFASAKHGLRALAQSMARELGPKSIHVCHVVIDAAVDTEWIRQIHPEYDKKIKTDGIVDPNHLADNYIYLHNQPRDAWTFELDLRPWQETW